MGNAQGPTPEEGPLPSLAAVVICFCSEKICEQRPSRPENAYGCRIADRDRGKAKPSGSHPAIDLDLLFVVFDSTTSASDASRPPGVWRSPLPLFIRASSLCITAHCWLLLACAGCPTLLHGTLVRTTVHESMI
jgi:hypothetical protein